MGSCANLIVICLLICLASEQINAQARWLNAHATYYGADQNPTSLGKSSVYFSGIINFFLYIYIHVSFNYIRFFTVRHVF